MLNLVLRPIDKDIPFCRMSMKIKKNLRLKCFGFTFNYFNFIKVLTIMKNSIQISSTYTSSEISQDNPIDIDHRNYLELNFISQVMSFWRTEILYKPINHPTPLTLSRMKPSNSQAALFIRCFCKICQSYNRQR